jgi:mevalonate kinase
MDSTQLPHSPYFDLSIRKGMKSFDQNYFGHGKILLSGEYFVLDGADALALPTQAGQSLSVKYEQSYSPSLSWRAYDSNGELWFEVDYEFWNFEITKEDQKKDQKAIFLQSLLRQARKQNKHFLREDINVYVETKLGFPKDWGLGSSSSLIYNMAQWAYISPFELLFETTKGSGYDVACAQSNGAILYNLGESGPLWSPVSFSPSFKSSLFFVYLGRKQNTQNEIINYQEIGSPRASLVNEISLLTRELLTSSNIEDFSKIIQEHERIVSDFTGNKVVQDRLFSDFPGAVKSLGAWGGDFVLASSSREKSFVKKYFCDKGYEVVIPYDKIILTEIESERREYDDRIIH